MAASIVIEEEHGSGTRSRHPHNGYYAGDFRTARSAPSHELSLGAFAHRAAITSAIH